MPKNKDALRDKSKLDKTSLRNVSQAPKIASQKIPVKRINFIAAPGLKANIIALLLIAALLGIGLPLFILNISIAAGLLLMVLGIAGLFYFGIQNLSFLTPFNRTALCIGAINGAFAGGIAGFYLGSFFPVIGNLFGALIGASLGSLLGSVLSLTISHGLDRLYWTDPEGMLTAMLLSPVGIGIGITAGALIGFYLLPAIGPILGGLIGAAFAGSVFALGLGIAGSYFPTADIEKGSYFYFGGITLAREENGADINTIKEAIVRADKEIFEKSSRHRMLEIIKRKLTEDKDNIETRLRLPYLVEKDQAEFTITIPWVNY